jgi:integration host factor subunit beta
VNKSNLIKKLSNKLTSHVEEDVENSVKLIIDKLTQSLINNDRIEVRNFGTFSIRSRERRLSRNPKTGTSVVVEPKHHPHFRASKYLKESLNK